MQPVRPLSLKLDYIPPTPNHYINTGINAYIHNYNIYGVPFVPKCLTFCGNLENLAPMKRAVFMISFSFLVNKHLDLVNLCFDLLNPRLDLLNPNSNLVNRCLDLLNRCQVTRESCLLSQFAMVAYINICNPVKMTETELTATETISTPLVEMITNKVETSQFTNMQNPPYIAKRGRKAKLLPKR